MTLDVRGQNARGLHIAWAWEYEIFCVCRSCQKSSILFIRLSERGAEQTFSPAQTNALVAYPGALGEFFSLRGYISLKDEAPAEPPLGLTPGIEAAFREGAACLAIDCPNAAGTMFRLCIDLATAPLLPDPSNESVAQPNHRQRRDLALRLQWLFDEGKLPQALHELAGAVREDGNDGAHRGTLTMLDAEDMLDFTRALLDRLYAEPKRIADAKERRDKRRGTRP